MLYHHGVPAAAQPADARAARVDRLDRRSPPPRVSSSRSRCTMIDAIDLQLVPFDHDSAARTRAKQAGVSRDDRSDLRDRCADRLSRSSPSSATPADFTTRATSCATPAWTSPSTSQMSAARPGISPVKDRPRCAGRFMRQRKSPGRGARSPDRPCTTSKPSSGSAETARASRSHASC